VIGLPALITVLLALIAYLITLSPSISFARGVSDSGELAAAAYALGVPHPTGYPLYMLLGWLVGHLPLGEPAHSLNCFSALCGALAAGLVAAMTGSLLGRVTGDSGADGCAAPPPVRGRADRGSYLVAFGALAGGLSFAANPSFWLQATNIETRTLAMLLVTVVLLILTGSPGGCSRRSLAGAWAVEGLAIADHLLCLAIVPALLFATATCSSPSWAQVTGRALAARGRRAATAVAAILPGLALYAYLPLRAAAGPPMDWGDPRTLPRFVWMVTGAQYRPLMGLAPSDILQTLGQRAQTLASDMGVIVLLAGAVGFVLLCWRQPRPATMLGLCFVAGVAQSAFYEASAAPDYLIVCEAIIATNAGYLLGLALAAGSIRLGTRWRMRCAWPGIAVLAAVAAAGGLTYQVSQQRATAAQQNSQMAQGYALISLRGLPAHAIVLAAGDEDTFPLWYAQFALGIRPDVAVVNTDLLAWQWYAESVRGRYPWLRWDGARWPGADNDLVVSGRDERAAARETALIHANVRRVPIFWTTPDVLGGSECGMASEGNLVRCVPLH
jgi:hypothetical protein